MSLRSGHPATVTAMLDAAVAANAVRPALHYQGGTVTYGAFAERVRCAAGLLAAQGVGPGDRVALWLANTPAYLELLFACARLGAIAVAVNTRFRAAEVGDLLHRSGAKLLALWPGFRGIDFPDILRGVEPSLLTGLETLLIYGDGDGDIDLPDARAVPYAEVETAEPYEPDHAGPDRGCIIFTTSGTTRAPKLVLHGQAGIAVHAAEVVRAFGYDAADTVVLQAIPLCGVFGFCQAMATLAAGRPLILMPAFDADEAVALCRQFTVTNFEATDGMVDAMLRAAPDDAPFQAVRRVGFAAFDRELEDLPARAGARGIPMVGLWGMSEMQALVASRPPDATVADRSRAGGQLVSPQAAARVRDPDSGELLPPGQPGALEIAGPSCMLGYFGNPEATAETLTEDGFVRTGDLAVLEPDGGFEFLARMGDSLRLGGFLVNPAEIESEIEAQPGVAAAQVIEVAMDGRNRPFAFVTASADASLDEAAVQAACADRMAAYKRPVRVVALDAFPVTESANGTKIQRTRLREMAQAMVDRTAASDG